MGDKTKVFIDGKAGTTGLRIYERLEARADIQLLQISEAQRKDEGKRSELINAADIVFLCLPDEAARQAVALVKNDKVRIIDASTAHRTVSGWVYGFAELSSLHREQIGSSKCVAVPGCHASGFNGIVFPLVKSGLMPRDYPASCTSLTGYSGGGKAMIADYQNADREKILKYPANYALSQQHKHLIEMQKISGLSTPPIFQPIVCDFYSGMAVSVPIFTRLLNERAGVLDIYELFCQQYNGTQLVKVMPPMSEGSIYAGELSGRDSMKIYISGNDERVEVTAVFDNLGKGASGAAVQCMNIMMGVNESLGLD